MKNPRKILITTGIYPPEIGGPAEYARNLALVWKEQGNDVAVKVFSKWNFLPTGIRHIVYFFSILASTASSDFIVVLDTFSSALPAVLAAKIFGKKIIIRTGGDFLWENYVERTGDLVLLRDFYETSFSKLSTKERIIFRLTRFNLRHASGIVFSTKWQKELFEKAYNLAPQKNFIIENFYGEKLASFPLKEKNFLAFTRQLKWKNLDILRQAFKIAQENEKNITLDTDMVLYQRSLEKIQESYALILVSLGDISPNMILDALRHNKPFICTRETGIYDRIKEVGIFVDPKNINDIAEKILFLSQPDNYQIYKKKIEQFKFTHSWREIADEFLNIASKI